MSEIETKTEAELAIGDVLTGAESELRAQGCLLFKEVEEDDEEDEEGGPAQDFDEEEYEDAFLAHWEKWELVGPGRYDYWVEVHHDSGEISLYEPLPSVGLANQIDPIDPTDLVGFRRIRARHSPAAWAAGGPWSPSADSAASRRSWARPPTRPHLARS